ncbi:(E)-4-hydroxy-3-methylbut-2-enyl-diphosphate synthase [Myxococcota bacterium]|nr:(E)-4-hydroxy-3-methylbut-2-enyl-diphosphate synthase [Myxococcota bacterium]
MNRELSLNTKGLVNSEFFYQRETTREVSVGDCVVGGLNPIRIQSMTTTDTQDIQGTTNQVERLVEAGCEIVRVTAPSLRDAEALFEIRRELKKRRINVPLVADIHFTPNAALKAAEAVEKVRINPGNYADKKRFEVREYTETAYLEELERAAERFRPLVIRLKALGRALRIGTNHGSLSDRILNRFGDTPLGMVKSALEFLDVCESENFYSVIFSMKASNPQVAVHAYRLLAKHLREREPEKPRYPFHVGVTEAGGGTEGRVKSSIGIGALLEDSLGETIRVSLTEDPVREIPVAQTLARRFEGRPAGGFKHSLTSASYVDDRHRYKRRPTLVHTKPLKIGGSEDVRVELCVGHISNLPSTFIEDIKNAETATELHVESLLVDVDQEGVPALCDLRENLAREFSGIALAARVESGLVKTVLEVSDRVVLQVFSADDFNLIDEIKEFLLDGKCLEIELIHQEEELFDLSFLKSLNEKDRAQIIISISSDFPVQATRMLSSRLKSLGLFLPIVLRQDSETPEPFESRLISTSSNLGSLLCDGIGDCISVGGFSTPEEKIGVAYRVLQGARRRTSWTEFISCPSCGRTLFDLEEVTERVREKTSHLSGLKIAIMGCVVNGPGEMADADFGYVGSGFGKVNLYVGQDCVIRNIPELEAPDRLVDLIKERGCWIDAAQDG